MDKAIILENLTKKYKNNRGIEDITLDVNQGEIYGFLGPNGAGKSTAMKVMTGLMRPDNGKVVINGYNIFDEYEKAMESVGCIIENVTPFPYMTAFENMKLCARFYKGVDAGRIDYCLNSVGLLKYKNEKVKNFSLGMKQRMGIAASMLSNPKVLILDEPLNGLDVEGMVDMRNLIHSMSENEGTTFFISSHLIHDVELTCNRVGILSGGKFIKSAYTKDILKDFSSLENYYLSEVDVDVKS